MSQNDSKGKISSQKYCQIWTQQGQLSLYLLPNLGQALLSQAVNCAVSVLKLIKFEDWSCPLFWIAEFVFENVCGASSCGGFRAVSQKKTLCLFVGDGPLWKRNWGTFEKLYIPGPQYALRQHLYWWKWHVSGEKHKTQGVTCKLTNTQFQPNFRFCPFQP